MEQNNRSSGMISNNAAYITSEVISIRLDTSKLLQDVEIFLKGEKIVPEIDKQTNNVTAVIKKVGSPLMNDLGVQGVLNFLSILINPHVSQGNITRSDYERLVYEVDVNLSINIMNNLERWDVKILDYDHILDGIIGSLQYFLSQPIDAGTRNSLTQSIRVAESNTTKESGGFKLPFFG